MSPHTLISISFCFVSCLKSAPTQFSERALTTEQPNEPNDDEVELLSDAIFIFPGEKSLGLRSPKFEVPEPPRVQFLKVMGELRQRAEVVVPRGLPPERGLRRVPAQENLLEEVEPTQLQTTVALYADDMRLDRNLVGIGKAEDFPGAQKLKQVYSTDRSFFVLKRAGDHPNAEDFSLLDKRLSDEFLTQKYLFDGRKASIIDRPPRNYRLEPDFEFKQGLGLELRNVDLKVGAKGFLGAPFAKVQYHVKDSLGSGVFGETLLVELEGPFGKTSFAIKKMGIVEGQKILMAREMELHGFFNGHPNHVLYFGGFKGLDGKIYQISEVLQSDMNGLRMTPKMALDMIRGLKEMHRFGITHFDPHPGNFLLSENGVVKITDFGSSNRAHFGYQVVAPMSPDYASDDYRLLLSNIKDAATGDADFMGAYAVVAEKLGTGEQNRILAQMLPELQKFMKAAQEKTERALGRKLDPQQNDIHSLGMSFYQLEGRNFYKLPLVGDSRSLAVYRSLDANNPMEALIAKMISPNPPTIFQLEREVLAIIDRLE